MLVVCEEAHRYVPSDPSLGFVPTRQAIARIAKEGRKYGVSLGIITQRPGELDQTILSQCSTLFAMRLSNDRDQEIIRSAIPEFVDLDDELHLLDRQRRSDRLRRGDQPCRCACAFPASSEQLLPKANGASRQESRTKTPIPSICARS